MTKWLLAGALLVVGGLVLFAATQDSVKTVKFKFSATAVEFNLEKGQMEFAQLLRWLFEQEDKSATTSGDGLLRRLRNWILGEARANPETDKAAKASREDAQALLLDRMSKASPDHPISKRLRDLEYEGVGPFERKERRVLVSFPGNLSDKTAAACPDSVFKDKDIALLNRDGSNGVRLRVGGTIVP